jgi:ribonuclease R
MRSLVADKKMDLRIGQVTTLHGEGGTLAAATVRAKDGELVMIEPTARHGVGGPRARVLERLGSMDEPKTVSLIAIHAHGIPTEFPRDAIAEAENARNAGPHGRTDLRQLPLVTIDPEDARDHDDAVWAGPDPDPKNAGGHL